MNGLEVARLAMVSHEELTLDPEFPFRVKPVARLPEKRRKTIRRAMLAAGWNELDDGGRAALARVLLRRMDDPYWEEFVQKTFDARCEEEPVVEQRWSDPPWSLWRGIIDDEAARRESVERVKRATAPMKQMELPRG